MTRTAISPRLATSSFTRGPSLALEQHEELAVLDRLGVLDGDLADDARAVGHDLVEELHGLDQAEHLPGLDVLPLADEGVRLRRGRPVERPHHGALDPVEPGVC